MDGKVLHHRFDPSLPAVRNQDPMGNVGYDLYAVLTDHPEAFHGDDGLCLRFEPYEQKRVPVNLAVAPPAPFMMGGIQVVPWTMVSGRSGMTWDDWDVQLGVIDPSYRGQIQVVLHNDIDRKRLIRHGDRIAQALFMLSFVPQLVEVDTLPASVRGTLGFGSSGRSD